MRLMFRIFLLALALGLGAGGIRWTLVNHCWPVQDIPVLLYHEIGQDDKDRYLAPDRFLWMINYLQRKKMSVLSWEKCWQLLQRQEKLPAWPVVLTFDDGEKSIYTTAFPILRQAGFPTTLFVISEFIGQTLYHDIAHRTYTLIPSQVPHDRIWKLEMLTWDQVREMERCGFSIQSHSVNHAELMRLDPASLTQQLQASRKMIEHEIQNPVRYFSYPWGEYNEAVKQALQNCQYIAGFACQSGQPLRIGMSDYFSIRRYVITPATSQLDFKIIVWGCMPWKEQMQRLCTGKNLWRLIWQGYQLFIVK